jgi:2-dehydropantoate 2-reductase
LPKGLRVTDWSWPRVAVVGAGAVGCFYGGMLARAGAAVTLIGRPAHVQAIERDGLRLETLAFTERVALTASTDMAAAQGAALVLFCVKSTDTDAAAQALAPFLTADSIVLSLQNGVDNVERLRARVPGRVFAAVVYVAAAMAGAGHVRHTGRGDLVIGAIDADPLAREVDPPTLRQIATWFERAGIGCVVSDSIEGELWAKLLINCAYNAISALGRARYRRIGAHPPALGVLQAAVREVIAVAQAAGVRLPEADLVEAACAISRTMAGATSSTAQDIARGKRTEIDHLNGYVVRRGEALGVPVPVNRTLHALVKLLEAAEPDEAR